MNVRMLKDIYSYRDVRIEFLDSVGNVYAFRVRCRALIVMEKLHLQMFALFNLFLLLNTAICSCKALGLSPGGAVLW